MNFKILKRTGLHQKGELETLLGVSRVMLNRYAKGATPGKHTAPRIELAMKVLGDLLKQEKLPLPEDYDRERRLKAVEKLKVFIEQRL